MANKTKTMPGQHASEAGEAPSSSNRAPSPNQGAQPNLAGQVVAATKPATT